MTDAFLITMCTNICLKRVTSLSYFRTPYFYSQILSYNFLVTWRLVSQNWFQEKEEFLNCSMYTKYFRVNQILPKPFNTISCMCVWFDRDESWPWCSAWISKTWKVLTKNAAFHYLGDRKWACVQTVSFRRVCVIHLMSSEFCYIFVYISTYLVYIFFPACVFHSAFP